MPGRRSELEIAVAILRAIKEEASDAGNEARSSRVQARVYLSWNVFNRHISKLRGRGLIGGSSLILTDPGKRLLRRYGMEVRSFLEDFGFL